MKKADGRVPTPGQKAKASVDSQKQKRARRL